MMGCRFCDISKTKDDLIIYEDKEILSFLDAHPLSKGHFLVIPKKHYELIEDMPKDEFMELSGKACKLLKADGANIALNNGKVAGQQIGHVHIHVIPRYNGDKTKIRVGNENMDKNVHELNEIKNILAEKF
jgi:diadenosine tetraphosphate (Ap4A) HIT family hydrolase